MKVYCVLLLLALCVVLATARSVRPRGKPSKPVPSTAVPSNPTNSTESVSGTVETTVDAGRRGNKDRKGGKGGRRQRPDRPGRLGRPDRREDPEIPVDPVCENLNCQKPTADTKVCGTDGRTYRSECLLIKERCKGKIADTVDVASPGHCESKPQRGHGKKDKEGKRPGKEGRRPAGGRRGDRLGKDRWPKECIDFIGTTIEPVTVEDEGTVCTATCPVTTPENPLQPVCGTDGRTYESSCVLDLIACVTDNIELAIALEGACQ